MSQTISLENAIELDKLSADKLYFETKAAVNAERCDNHIAKKFIRLLKEALYIIYIN